MRAGAVASGSVDVRGTRFLYAARRNGGEAIVLLRPASRQAADWTPFALGLGLAGLVGAVLAALVALFLARAVARPIARASDASRALAAGERPEALPVSGPREASTLATSFNHLSNELARTQDAERSFLLSVSHELKTPLTAIRGHAEALEDGVLEAPGAAAVISARRGGWSGSSATCSISPACGVALSRCRPSRSTSASGQLPPSSGTRAWLARSASDST